MTDPTPQDHERAQAIVDKYVLATPAERLMGTMFPNDIAQALADERERLKRQLANSAVTMCDCRSDGEGGYEPCAGCELFLEVFGAHPKAVLQGWATQSEGEGGQRGDSR